MFKDIAYWSDCTIISNIHLNFNVHTIYRLFMNNHKRLPFFLDENGRLLSGY